MISPAHAHGTALDVLSSRIRIHPFDLPPGTAGTAPLLADLRDAELSLINVL
jgi:hypothetical protein